LGMADRPKQRVRSVSPPRTLTPEEKVAKQQALAAEGKVQEIVPGIESWLKRTGKMHQMKEGRRRRPAYTNIVVTVKGEKPSEQQQEARVSTDAADRHSHATSLSLLHSIRNLTRRVELLARDGVISMHFILTKMNLSEWKELANMPHIEEQSIHRETEDRNVLVQRELATRLAILQAAVDEAMEVQDEESLDFREAIQWGCVQVGR